MKVEIQGVEDEGFKESEWNMSPSRKVKALLQGGMRAVLALDRQKTHVDFRLPSEALDGQTSFTLLETQNGQPVLSLANPAISGDVLSEGTVRSLDELRESGQSYVMPPHSRARLKTGEFTILVSYVPQAVAPPTKSWRDLDYLLPILLLLSAIVHMTTLWIFSQQPEDRLRSLREMRERRADILAVVRAAEQRKQEEKQEEKQEDQEEQEDEDPDKLKKSDELVKDKRPKQPEQLVEEKLAKNKRDSLLDRLLKKRQKADEKKRHLMSPEERKKRAKDMVTESAAHQGLSSNTLNALLADNPSRNTRQRSLTAPNGAAGAAYAGQLDPFGGTLGDDSSGFLVTEGGGMGGGGGGSGGAGRDIAGLSTNELRDRSKRRNTDLSDRKIQRVFTGKAKVSGRLDRKTVQRYIRKKLRGVRACYQDALQRNAKTGGKVTLSFKILPSGSTAGAKALGGSIQDQALIKCITRRMSRWKFPQPADGGVVHVSYPLILKTT